MKTGKKHNTRIMVAVLLGMATMHAWAQPDWAVVPNDFEFTMTVTSLVKIDCVESLDTNDMVAAFIGNEVRGLQPFREFFNDHHFSFMTIYDNAFNGHEIHFKIYDASTNSIIDALETIVFQENTNVGGTEDPFVFHTSPGIDEVIVTGDSIAAGVMAYELVATLTSMDESNEAAQVSYSFVDDETGADNHYFTIYGDELLLNVDASAIDHEVLNLHVLATPVTGCALEYSFQLFKAGSSTVAVEPTAAAKNSPLQVFPNPTNGMIRWDEDIDADVLSVYDMQGRMVVPATPVGNSSFDLSSLTTGAYILRLISNGNAESLVVVRE